MTPIVLKVKKLHPNAVLPKRANSTDAGYDLVALDCGQIVRDNFIEYNSGIAIELPPGYHALIHPRSSISSHDLILANSIGLVDNGYRGPILCRFKIVPPQKPTEDFSESGGVTMEGQYQIPWFPKIYCKGDRIAQLVIEKTVDVEVQAVEELSTTARGAGGFGSTNSG